MSTTRLRHFAALALALAGCTNTGGTKPANPAMPMPTLRFPVSQTRASSRVLLIATQDNPALDPTDIAEVDFEASIDQQAWLLVDTAPSPYGGALAGTVGEWDGLWDTSGADAGSYYVRASMTTAAGARVASAPIVVGVSALPSPVVSATLGGDPGLVQFDGGATADPNGAIVEWDWDFGDGTSVVAATTTTTTHIYKDTSTPNGFVVTVTVKDAMGGVKRKVYDITFGPAFSFTVSNRCICTSIALRGQNLPAEKTALGPNGDQKSGWPIPPKPGVIGFDGTTLGPLDGSNNNPNKLWAGYAFEIDAHVDGDPDLCGESQLVRMTATYNALFGKAQCDKIPGATWDATKMICTRPHIWHGTLIDVDQDGKVDVDVSTPVKCAAAGGTWYPAPITACGLSVPVDGMRYLPDTPFVGLSLYDAPYDYKVHLPGEILWLDAPEINTAFLDDQQASFVSFVRGTDKKYCYVKFDVHNQANTPPPNTETLKQTEVATGAAAIPGVP